MTKSERNLTNTIMHYNITQKTTRKWMKLCKNRTTNAVHFFCFFCNRHICHSAETFTGAFSSHKQQISLPKWAAATRLKRNRSEAVKVQLQSPAQKLCCSHRTPHHRDLEDSLLIAPGGGRDANISCRRSEKRPALNSRLAATLTKVVSPADPPAARCLVPPTLDQGITNFCPFSRVSGCRAASGTKAAVSKMKGRLGARRQRGAR